MQQHDTHLHFWYHDNALRTFLSCHPHQICTPSVWQKKKIEGDRGIALTVTQAAVGSVGQNTRVETFILSVVSTYEKADKILWGLTPC